MKFIALVLLVGMATACRTPDPNALKDDVGAVTKPDTPEKKRALSCKFVTESPRGESMEIAGDPVAAGGLGDVLTRYVSRTGADAKERKIAAAARVDAATITKNGARELRSYFKGVLALDLKTYECSDLEGKEGPAASYLCLGKAAGAGRPALWITNASHMKYAFDLTVYESNCN